jgi:hypothetical protein
MGNEDDTNHGATQFGSRLTMRAMTPGESLQLTALLTSRDNAALPASENAFVPVCSGGASASPEKTSHPMRATNAVRVAAVLCRLIISIAPSVAPASTGTEGSQVYRRLKKQFLNC